LLNFGGWNQFCICVSRRVPALINGILKSFACEWETVAQLFRVNEFTENKLLRQIVAIKRFGLPGSKLAHLALQDAQF
jgi:hypothetical protein